MTATVHAAGSGLLAAGDAPNAHLTARVLLTYFQTDLLSIVTDLLLILVAIVYVVGVRRLASKGRGWSGWSTAAFMAGLCFLFLAVGSGLAAYDDINLSAHVIQHLFLMMIAPPLLALGRPVTLLAQASSRPVQVRVLKVANSRALGVISGPIAWVAYYGAMWVFFLTPIYRITGEHPLLHDATHVIFFTLGYLFWQGVVGLDASSHRVSHALRLGALFIGMPIEAFLGLAIMSMARPIAPGYTLANTHDGGATFWITSMFVMAIAILVSLGQWVRSEDRKAARIDAAFDRHAELGEPQITEEELARLRAFAAPGRPLPGTPATTGHRRRTTRADTA